jgi:S-adenosylmethionine:tRNA ribosyltransferase-isomerase
MVVHRATRTIEHRRFPEIADYLRAGDLLVVNDSRVLPARLVGRKQATGGAWEGLYLRTLADGRWEMIGKTRRPMQVGTVILIEPGPLRLIYQGKTEAGHWCFQPDPPGDAVELLERHGRIPLPPYIRDGIEQPQDRQRYQTVYAKQPGSIAAPTAGLHFTQELLEQLQQQGVRLAQVTLHVGLGTFQPIKAKRPSEHVMHREWCAVPAETAEAIAQCRAAGGRIVAVGTTTVRTLETAARFGGAAWSGETDLFIRPGFRFQLVDALVTNFHLPRSTLMQLVAAFSSPQLIRTAYAEAIAQRYRFYSYGDAMLIL